MYIVMWLKGPNATTPYLACSNSGYAKEFPTVDEAKKHIENAIAGSKMSNYDAFVLDADKHEVAAWAAALPPALKWNEAVTSEPAKS